VAAKAATTSIPIVFIANNPVELGIVASLDRPGGNLTGIGLLVADLVAKQLEFLKEVVPQASALAYLQNPKSPTAALNEGSVRDAREAGDCSGDAGLYGGPRREIDCYVRWAQGCPHQQGTVDESDTLSSRASVRPHHLQHINAITLELALPDAADLR
jgi:ABC transporter substrate binding protein